MMFAKLSYLNNEMYLTLPTLFNVDVYAYALIRQRPSCTAEEFYILLIITFHIVTDLNRLENIKINL